MHYNRPPKTQKSLSLGEVTHWFNQTHTYIHDEKKKKGSMTLWLNTLSDIRRQSLFYFFSLLNEIKADVKETTTSFFFTSSQISRTHAQT